MTSKLIFMTLISALCLSGCDAASGLFGNPDSSKMSAASASPGTVAAESQISEAKAVKPLGYLLDVNDATMEQLSRVPGLTPEILNIITDLRPFLDMVEFDDELSLIGMSSKDRSALYEHLFMVIDVNNSPKEDFQFVPNLSNSLEHKIETGRPYKDVSALKAVILDAGQDENLNHLMQYFKVTKSNK